LNFWIMIESVEKYSSKDHMNKEWSFFFFLLNFDYYL
jgi:hypothetical protein